MDLVLVNLNVIQCHGILKECNLLCMFMYAFSWMDVIASATMWLMWMVYLSCSKKKMLPDLVKL